MGNIGNLDLTCEEECGLLLDMARRASDPRMAKALRGQADGLSDGIEAGGSWAFVIDPDCGEDGPISEWLIGNGRCGICVCGYQPGDGVFFVRPLVTAHRRCVQAQLPAQDGFLDDQLGALAAARGL